MISKEFLSLLQTPAQFGAKERVQVKMAFENLYAQLGLEAPAVLLLESPYQLQIAVKRCLNKTHVFRVPTEGFNELNRFLEQNRNPKRINQQVWSLVGDNVARALFLAYSDESKLWSGHQSFRSVFQPIEDAVDSENNRLLGRDKLKVEALAHHPNWLDFKWLQSYKDHLDQIPLAKDLWAMHEAGLMQAYCFDSLVLWCPKPQQVEIEDGQLHSEDGPALMWSTNYKLYYWHGVKVPAKLIEAPELITRQDIDAHQNAEVRRCFQERLGGERFAKLFDLKMIDSDLDLQGNMQYLYRSAEEDPVAKEFIQFARVTCPTTGRAYFLCVPPNLGNVWEAVAWTFSKQAQDYKPKSEV